MQKETKVVAQPQVKDAKELTKEPVWTYLDSQNRQVKLSTSIVRKFFCPQADEVEAITFIKTAQSLRANPWLRQIYLIKYDPRSPAQIVVSYSYFLQLVTSMPNYRGMRSGVIVVKRKTKTNEVLDKIIQHLKPALDDPDLSDETKKRLFETLQIAYENRVEEEPEIVEVEGAVVPPGTELYGGWAEIYLKNPENPSQHIVIKQRVMFSEYNKNQATWRQIPATMIEIVAIRQAARRAFSETLGGVYGPEELGVPVDEYGTPIVGQVEEVNEQEIVEDDEGGEGNVGE